MRQPRVRRHNDLTREDDTLSSVKQQRSLFLPRKYITPRESEREKSGGRSLTILHNLYGSSILHKPLRPAHDLLSSTNLAPITVLCTLLDSLDGAVLDEGSGRTRNARQRVYNLCASATVTCLPQPNLLQCDVDSYHETIAMWGSDM